MKKKLFSLILNLFLLIGLLSANATYIEFEDVNTENNILSLNAENSETSKIEILGSEEMIINTSEATEEKNEINIYSDDIILMDENTSNYIGYIKNASGFKYYGNSELYNENAPIYNNTEVNYSKYVVYSNAVIINHIKYDLVIYPFGVTGQATCINNYPYVTSKKISPGFRVTNGGYAGYKIIITEHGDINMPIDVDIMLGFSDLDTGEFVIMPTSFIKSHQGVNVSSTTSSLGNKYTGLTVSSTDDEKFNTNCIFGQIHISKNGVTVYYGSDSNGQGTLIAFDSLKNYIDNNGYTIQFDINGGIGNIPSSIMKLGSGTSTILGNIGNAVPTKEGYIFKGWSAVPELNSKRIAYNSSNIGATQTNDSWTYADYCNYTGGDSSNRTLTLYAQWEANSYTVTINKGIGIESVTGSGDYKYGEDVTINATLLPGYAWANWTGTHSTNTQEYTFKMPASNVTDTANATPITYKIIYNLDGGSLSKENPKIYTVETETFILNNPTKTGYTFLGWTGSNGTAPDKNVSVPKGSIEDKTYVANWQVNQYPVTYIDVDSDGNEIGRTTKMVDYGTSVRGAELGNDISDNVYYNQYKYVSDTSATVTTEGAVVYRVFEFCKTEAMANLQWNDNNNADGFRPSKYKLKLKQNGKVIDEVELPSDETNYTFPNLPKYDSNGNVYKYSFDVDASNRYQIDFDEDGNLIVEDYQPANFSVIIPKAIVLDGITGNADYTVSINGTFYYNDTLIVIPESSLILTDRSKISSMQADVLQQKTTFTKEDGVASGATATGSISADRKLFAGSWSGNFNFNISFKMQN